MGNRRPKVLVVEHDDTVALGIHRTLYRANARFDVLVAGSAEVGRTIMREMAVDVLITDIHLPGMSGLDLAYWAAVESPETQFVLITGSDVNTHRDQARALGCLRLVSKPFEPAELRNIVLEALECRERLYGKLSALSAADLIQMLCLGQKTNALRITADGITGTVMIESGRLIHASWGDSLGESAIRSIVAIEDGVFSMTPLPAGTPHTITRDWQYVLMEAARLFDEDTQASKRDPLSRMGVRADDATFGKVVAEDSWQLPARESDPVSLSPDSLEVARLRADVGPAVGAARLVDRGFSALRSGNLSLARRCWQAAQRLDPENRSIELNLRRLESLASR